MEFYEQKLEKWILNKQLNSLYNVKFEKPTWANVDDYYNQLFIYKRDLIELQQAITWEIVDRQLINWVDFILVRNWTTIKIMYDNWSTYVDLWNPKTINSKSPLTFVKWIWATWTHIASAVSLWDAFFEIHNKWTYDVWTKYQVNDIVEDTSVYYISIKASEWVSLSDTDYWKVYDTTNSWMANWDPTNISYWDVFKWQYLVLKLTQTWIKAKVSAWQYIYFTKDNSNLQWITSRIEYVQDLSTPSPDWILVYIKTTNRVGTIPQYKTSWWETIDIYSWYWDSPMIASTDWLYVYNLLYSWWNITWCNEQKVLNLSNIVDICIYNNNIFAANEQLIAFSRLNNWWTSNINFYPLDILEIKWTYRLVPFGKMLILFWDQNKVITPINNQQWNEWYINTDLNFEEGLFSKYSCYSYMWVFYMIKSNKEIVKINISTINEVFYEVEELDILEDTKWLLDDINWEVYISLDWKDLNIINHRWWTTYVYKYNIEYLTWWVDYYENIIYKIYKWLYYWDNVYKVWAWEEIEQKVSFVLWTELIQKQKSIKYIKIMFWLKWEKIDWFLDIEYELWWHLHSYTIDLNKYLINMDLHQQEWWLWDSLIWMTVLWENEIIKSKHIWNLHAVLIPIWITAYIMRFTIRSKPTNEFIYWGSVVWYESLDISVTEYSNKH